MPEFLFGSLTGLFANSSGHKKHRYAVDSNDNQYLLYCCIFLDLNLFPHHEVAFVYNFRVRCQNEQASTYVSTPLVSNCKGQTARGRAPARVQAPFAALFLTIGETTLINVSQACKL